MPAATPQTAQRKMRSQSPPRLTHRRPVTYVHSAIAASSVRPYMWMVNGPSSSVPELGEGIDARVLTARALCRSRSDLSGCKPDQWRGSGGTGRFPQLGAGLRQPLRLQLGDGG